MLPAGRVATGALHATQSRLHREIGRHVGKERTDGMSMLSEWS